MLFRLYLAITKETSKNPTIFLYVRNVISLFLPTITTIYFIDNCFLNLLHYYFL